MTETRPTRQRRSWGGYLLMAGVLAVVLVVAAPTLFSHQPLLGWLMRRILGKVEGTVLVESGSFGWTTPTQITGLKIINPAGEPVLNIARLRLDASLRQILFPSEDLGAIDVDGLELFILADRGRKTNLEQAFPPPPPSTDRSGKPEPPKGLFVTAGAQLNINAAQLVWQLGGEGERWRLNPIDLHARIVPAHQTTHGRPELQLPPTVLFDRLELTEALCDDVLRYIAPNIANATQPQGSVSLAFAEAKLPLGAMQLGELSGELALHTVKFGPGPLIKSIASHIRAPTQWHVELAHETVVPFRMVNGRVYHQNFEVGLGKLRIESSGSTGLDDTLDLTERIFVRANEAELTQRPLLRAMSEQGLSLPVKGTFTQPDIDDTALGADLLNLSRSILQNWSLDKPEAAAPQLLQNLVQGLTKAAAPTQVPAPSEAAPQVDLGALIGDAAKALGELRKQRLSAREAAGETEPPKKPLGKLLDRLRKSTEKPAPEPQP